ncbi:MAG: methyl-accepting chemotaxis protein [Gallionella sp.]|nr:methyl-accepting chemotaxis protein [Gallionella sp.]
MFTTIRAKLIGFSFFSLLSIVLVGLSGYFGQTGIEAIESAWSANDSIKAGLMADKAHIKVHAEVLQLLRTAKNGDFDGSKEAEKNLKKHLDALKNDTFRNASSATLAEKTRQAVSTFRASAGSYAVTAQSIATEVQTDPSGAEAKFNDLNVEYGKLEVDYAAASKLIAADMDESRRAAIAASRQLTNIAIAVGVAAFLLLSFSAIFVYRSIMSPLNQLRQVIAKIEAGAYEVRVKLRAQDELGSVGRAIDKLLDDRISLLKTTETDNERLNNSVIGLFSAMGALAQKDLTVRAPVTDDIIGTLGDAINQLTDVTATVLHHVTKVAGVVEAASERMKQQSDVVNEMAKQEDVIVVRLISNLETAMASIGEVAIFARDSNRAAAEATKSTESAMETVQATLVGMNAIRETISEMEKRIKRLGERSQEISQIVNLINTISERTHVLSLNAAMQAAMAGEAGRGFAVVAEEVQRLAENSRQATGQIANLVQNIQVETNDTIATVNKTIEQVVKESELAHDAGERMRETHEATARLVRLVATIATSSAEQTRIAAVLRTAADEIAQFTEKTAEQLVAQNQSAASLVSASQKLVGAISVFKLPSTEPSVPGAAERAMEDDGDRTQIFAQFK